jgi:hypothetical protein
MHAGRTTGLAITIAFALSSLPAVALAAEPAPAQPKAKADPGERTHDGFYLRTGIAFGKTWLEYDAPMTTEVRHEGRADGRTGSFELAMGGTLPFGLVLGGILFIRPMSGLEFENSAVTEGWDSTNVSLSEGATFARYYPFPRHGLHFEGFLGVVRYSIESKKRVLTSFDTTCVIVLISCAFAAEYETVTVTEDAWGHSLGAGAGYDLWIGKQWSFGFTARGELAHAWKEERRYWFTLATLGLGFTYH